MGAGPLLRVGGWDSQSYGGYSLCTREHYSAKKAKTILAEVAIPGYSTRRSK
jgi:hypothetical protein